MSEHLVTLPESLTIAGVESLHQELESLLSGDVLTASAAGARDGEFAVTLDAATVNRVDTACLQTLAAFIAALRQIECHWHWRSPSEPFVLGVRRLGLSDQLGLD